MSANVRRDPVGDLPCQTEADIPSFEGGDRGEVHTNDKGVPNNCRSPNHNYTGGVTLS